MPLVRPRLTDFFNVAITQEEADFAIPFLNEDIPLNLDPFLLWKSPSQQDQSLHTSIVNSFNYLGKLVLGGQKDRAKHNLIQLSECQEVGLGFSQTRKGHRISEKIADDIVALFENVPQIREAGFAHFEEIQLLIENVSKDRISDIACNFLMSFLVDFTIEQCERLGIPRDDVTLPFIYEYRTNSLKANEKISVPINPETKEPLVFVPKRWLRALPWINYEDYIESYYLKKVLQPGQTPGRVAVLNYNRDNYGLVAAYAREKERVQVDCKMDPLFKQLPVTSVLNKINQLKKLPTGLKDDNDQKYEQVMCHILPSMLYPYLDFAKPQSRTDSGVLIRDLIFYNSRSIPLLQDVYKSYGSQQIVFEQKNVKELHRDHVNQLNRYLNDTLGAFGIIVTRNPPPKSVFKNTVDLWSGQRRCILILSDCDIELMATVFESKQRDPIEVITSKLVEFQRACPS